MKAWIAPINRSKSLPDHVEEKREEVADRDVTDVHAPERRDEREHQAAGEKVPEKPQRQGYGLGDLLDHVDRGQQLDTAGSSGGCNRAMPLDRIETMCTGMMTMIASASVRLMSPVGGASHS